MTEKVFRLGIQRRSGFLYFLRWNGVYKTPMKNHGKRSEQGKITRVEALYFEREAGYLYFVDREGDVSRAKVGRTSAPARWDELPRY